MGEICSSLPNSAHSIGEETPTASWGNTLAHCRQAKRDIVLPGGRRAKQDAQTAC
jgi:hypothetical protein